MEQKLRLYIADVDPQHVANVCRSVSRMSSIEVAGSQDNGCCALKQIEKLQPDVLLTDIQLPGMDGGTLLKETQRLKAPPVGIVCTRFYSEASLEYACKNGASFFLYKPIEYDRLPGIITECSKTARATPPQEQPERQADERRRDVNLVRGLLLEMGISSRMTGSLYITESALRLMDNRLLLKNLSKGLYVEVAARLSTTPTRIERALRNAVKTAYDRGTLEPFFKYRPTNKEFIEYIMHRLNDAHDTQSAFSAL